MKTLFVLFLILTFLPFNLFSQWKRETGFTTGLVIPNYSKDFYDDKFEASKKFGISQSWYKPDQSISFRPEVGLNLEYLPVNVGFGGLGGGVTYDGSIFSINGELALMAQFQLWKIITISVGPAGKFLISDITNLNTRWWMWNMGSNESEVNGFNRDYLYKPSIGIKAMLFESNIREKFSLGLSVEHHWKGSSENIINYSKTSEISLYFGIH